jgi:hypothetical protein
MATQEEQMYRGDPTFEEMVKLDGESLQRMCMTNSHYRNFCSKDNEDFWKAKIRYDSGLLGVTADVDAKSMWLRMYEDVRKNSQAYYAAALDQDNANILRGLENMNVGLAFDPVYIISHRKYNVFDYMMSVAAKHRNEPEGDGFISSVIRELDRYVYSDPQRALPFVQILYKYHMYVTIPSPELRSSGHVVFDFYVSKGVIRR